MKKIILTTAAIAVSASSSALAIENDFFVKVNAGYSKMSKVKSAKAKNDMFFGIGAGYYVMDNVRADLTFDHFVNPTFKKDGKKIKGEVNTLLLNGFIDLFDISLAKKDLWMSEENLKEIESQGHVIGLHSFSHPTKISDLSFQEQELEYHKNNKHLADLIQKPIRAMSHPCGDYNKDTLNILSKMDIKIGFTLY